MDRTLGANFTIDPVTGNRKFAASPPLTTLDPQFVNNLQEELMGVIESQGIQGNANLQNQLLLAIQRVAAVGIPSADDVGAANAYIVNPSPAFAALSKYMTVRFKASAANTGAATVNVNGLGTVAIVQMTGAPLLGGEIPAGGIVTVVYNIAAANFQLVEAVPGVITKKAKVDAITDLLLANWAARANPANIALYGTTWASSLSLFVAVGSTLGTSAYIITSPDGATWTQRSNPGPAGQDLRAVTWSPRQSLLVAMGGPGTSVYIITSPDGFNWTGQPNPINIMMYKTIWASSLSLFVAVGGNTGTSAAIITSPDGAAWTQRSNPSGWTLYGAAWGATQSLIVAVGTNTGTGAYIITSPDGLNWARKASVGTILYGVAWGAAPSLFVAVGTVTGTSAYIFTSPDGSNWTQQSNPANYDLLGVTWGVIPSMFIAVGSVAGGNAYIITSPDGLNWTRRANPNNYALYDIAWGAANFAAVGNAMGGSAYVITNTLQWPN